MSALKNQDPHQRNSQGIGEKKTKKNVHPQPKLVQLLLHIPNNRRLENLPLLENLLHRHTTNNHSRLTLNNPLDNILDMVPTSRRNLLRGIGRLTRQDLRIATQRIDIIGRTNREDGRKRELEFLDRHGLELDFEVEGADGDAAVFLPWPDPGFFDDFDVGDAAAGDDEVGICV